MNLNNSIDWLYSFEKIGIKLGLDRIKHICTKLDNPQRNYNIIHVGGTNGKGSVCQILNSILIKNGYNVGLYTSPHLQRFSERIIINGIEISKEDIISLVKKIKPIVEKMIELNNTPTFFEIVTAIAFQYFSNKCVDYAIIEVGLGGRFDATNIVTPILTIITNVSLEHEDILGKKIENIALEKAGIIKKDVPIVTAAEDKALEKIKKYARKHNSKLYVVKKDSWKRESLGLNGQNLSYRGLLKDYYVKTNLIGIYEAENIALSIAAIEKLQMQGVFITDQSINQGIKDIKIAGRMEIIGSKPIIILDGAHNVDAIFKLRDSIKKDLIYDKLILIIGILSDKNIKKMLDLIVPISDVVIATKSSSNRAFSPNKIKHLIHDIDCKKQILIFDNIKNSIEKAYFISKDKDLILIAGSLYTIGEAKDYFDGKKCN